MLALLAEAPAQDRPAGQPRHPVNRLLTDRSREDEPPGHGVVEWYLFVDSGSERGLSAHGVDEGGDTVDAGFLLPPYLPDAQRVFCATNRRKLGFS